MLLSTPLEAQMATSEAEGVIMKIGGWRTRSVFEQYAIVSQADIADAIGKLEIRDGHSLGHSEDEKDENTLSPLEIS